MIGIAAMTGGLDDQCAGDEITSVAFLENSPSMPPGKWYHPWRVPGDYGLGQRLPRSPAVQETPPEKGIPFQR